MFKSLALFSLLAAVSAANAQSPNQADDPQSAAPSQPAPIVRTYPSNRYAHLQPGHPQNQIVESQPISGVWLRSESSGAMKTISATPQQTEIRLDRGRLNVSVHHPASHAEILVDLPGGQVSLFKDGLYTFNADTNTVRVLRGEAAAYPGPISAAASVKPIKIKEDHQLSLVAVSDAKSGATRPFEVRSVESYPYELTADLLPLGDRGDRAYADDGEDYPPYRYYAGAFGYPGFYPGYGYGYPFSYGIGFGYYGGFRGGYGYGRGFRH